MRLLQDLGPDWHSFERWSVVREWVSVDAEIHGAIIALTGAGRQGRTADLVVSTVRGNLQLRTVTEAHLKDPRRRGTPGAFECQWAMRPQKSRPL